MQRVLQTYSEISYLKISMTGDNYWKWQIRILRLNSTECVGSLMSLVNVYNICTCAWHQMLQVSQDCRDHYSCGGTQVGMLLLILLIQLDPSMSAHVKYRSLAWYRLGTVSRVVVSASVTTHTKCVTGNRDCRWLSEDCILLCRQYGPATAERAPPGTFHLAADMG